MILIGIFGANGFVGRHLVQRLVLGDIPVKLFSRRHRLEYDVEMLDRIQKVEGDFLHPLDRASALVGVDTVVQLISTSSPGLGNDFTVADIQENVIPHVDFMRECVNVGVGRFIFISSGGTVYGPEANIPTEEDAPTNPISSHGITKLIIEKYLYMHSYLDALETVILRVSNPYGPGQIYRKAQGLIAAILQQVSLQQPIRIFGDGENRRDYLYIDDLIDAIQLAINSPGVGSNTINIGSGESRSILEVISQVEHSLGRTIDREFAPARATDVGIALLGIDKAKRTLRWEPKTSFGIGIDKTVAEFRRNRDAF